MGDIAKTETLLYICISITSDLILAEGIYEEKKLGEIGHTVPDFSGFVASHTTC